MTNSESLLQFGPNAYSKPATGLNILRETILGRELFDFAFKQYALRWKFKRPEPADFFRTMEDASGVDLDWFWRGWFYTTLHTDISLDRLELYTLSTSDPEQEKGEKRKEREAQPQTLAEARNKPLPKRAEAFPELKDFYNDFDDLQVTDADRKAYQQFLAKLTDREKQLLNEKRNFYVIELSNVGGLVMPVIMELQFEDGSRQELRIPAEIWRLNSRHVNKLILTEKTIRAIVLDPQLETADTDLTNNHLPRQVVKSRFQLFQEQKSKNEMQQAQTTESGS
jgi:aminopeptidase N